MQTESETFRTRTGKSDDNQNSFQNMQSGVLRRKYLRKDMDGKVMENEYQMFRRVASHVAQAERQYDCDCKEWSEKFYRMMVELKFLPNSPCLMNAGRENSMLSACFVLPVGDSIDGIFEAVKNTALIQKAGGGTGFSFDRLRPTGDRVASSGGTTSGPISFWRVLSETTSAIQQGAFRRGANMGMMSVEHPDILKFIHAKRDLTAFTNFNISVKAPDSFMKKVRDNPYVQHVVINPRTRKRYHIPRSIDVKSYTIDDLLPEEQVGADCYSVKEIWDMIVTNAHATGEPGICFIDRVNSDNTTPLLGEIEATNPCGEQPLLPYEACTLGSINVAKFVSFTDSKARVDWPSLGETVKLAVRFLDDTIDVSLYPLEDTLRLAQANRKIGLGVMGFADCLFLLGIPYDSEQAASFAASLMKFINENAQEASSALADMRGAFPNWDQSTWRTDKSQKVRNASITCIAPTGTISIIANCSAGIEPAYSLVYERRVEDEKAVIINSVFEQIAKKHGLYRSGLIDDMLGQGSLRNIGGIPEKIKRVFVTAMEIEPEWHIRMQAAFQQHCDAAVSKTINLSQEATVADVDKAYKLAFELGCKGITVYRDNSRDNQVIVVAGKTGKLSPRPRVRKTKGKTTKFRMGCGTLFVTVNKDDNGICEVFANLGKAGGCPSQSEATCRAVSAALRCGINPEVLVEQLKNIRCLSTVASRKINRDIDVLSCPDAIARAIEEALGKGYEARKPLSVKRCPDCGQTLRFESGCDVCSNCGYSKCS